MASWLTSAIQTVREKSADALDFVRRDLTEFTSTVKNDTETYLNKIKSQDVDFPVKADNDDGKRLHPSASLDRVQSELNRLQNNEATYLNEPTPTEAYENWRTATDFNVDMRKGDIAQLLIDSPHIRAFYARLVPAQTTHSDFWSRYYFRLHQVEEEEARHTQLLRRAHEICTETDDNTGQNNENDWDEPDEEWPEKPVEESPPKTLPVDHQETVAVNTAVTNERKESDTVSGDSWERDFEESDLASSKSTPVSSTQAEEPVTSESLSSPAITTVPLPLSSTDKKRNNEFDDEWEAWS